jgi:ABC-type uncharacterized transport system involved in gliding motility auxiliary subunit
MSAEPVTQPTPAAAPNRTQFRLTMGLSIVIGLGILVLVNYLASRHYRRFDWTRSGLYSLSDKTEKILKDLKAPVTITVFMTEGSPLAAETQEVLRRYKAKSPLITVESLDPARNRARAEALVKEFGVRGETVVFKSGDKKKYVTSDQLAEMDFSRARMGGEPTIKAFKGEQEFTSAILSVTQAKAPKVLFTTGHGERSATSRSRDGFFALAETLRRDNCTVEDWASLGAAEVPAGTDAVVVAGPRSSFTEPEVGALKKYLDGGGRVLFFLDAELEPGASGMSDFGMRGLLAGIGIRLDDDIVVDPKNALPLMGPETVFAKSFRSHPITRILEGSAVVFPLARSVGGVEKPPTGWTATVLVETSADGWGETDLKNLESVKKDDKDVKGPVPLAAAAESAVGAAKTKARAVAFGDADFASNGYLANAANLYLLTASVNWALEREALVAIPPKAADQVSVTLSRGDIGRMTIVSLLLLPLAAIGFGLAVWVKRRR